MIPVVGDWAVAALGMDRFRRALDLELPAAHAMAICFLTMLDFGPSLGIFFPSTYITRLVFIDGLLEEHKQVVGEMTTLLDQNPSPQEAANDEAQRPKRSGKAKK
jgi:hypothetical protein